MPCPRIAPLRESPAPVMLSQPISGVVRRESQPTHDADLHEGNAAPDRGNSVVVDIVDRVAIPRRVEVREVIPTRDQELSVRSR
jgi:hypothetical protein